MRDSWWKFAVLGLVIVGLLMWRRGQTDNQLSNDVNGDAELEQQVNELLEQTNIQLPEGSERVNLRAEEGVVGTGVVSLSQDEDETMVAVIASLPDGVENRYSAWFVGDDVEPVRLGTLRLAKGGYLLDYTTEADLSTYEEVVVSEGSDDPEARLLSGQLPAVGASE